MQERVEYNKLFTEYGIKVHTYFLNQLHYFFETTFQGIHK